MINESDIVMTIASIYSSIISNIQKSLGQGSGWIIDSFIDHNINILKFSPLGGSRPSKKGLNNIQNIDDNECFTWFLVRHLNPADYCQARIANADKDFSKRFDFKDMKFSAKTRNTHKIGKKRVLSALVFLVMKIRKNIQSMYQKFL